MTAQLVRHSSDTSPGGKVTYSIWVWSTVTVRKVIASAVTGLRTMHRPRFTLCPVRHGARCTIGRLPASQAVELTITGQIRAKAKVGSVLTLEVTVSGASLSPAVAAVTTIVGRPGQTGPAPTTNPVPPLPPATLIPIAGSTVTPTGLSGLFPTVTPSPSASGKSPRARRLAGITQASSALPLDPRLIGGQLAGLAVLAAAITMVVARLSLRTAQSPAAAAAPATAPRTSPASPPPASATPASATPATASQPDPDSAGATPATASQPDPDSAGATPATPDS